MGTLLCGLLFLQVSIAFAEDGAAIRRSVGMITLAVQEYSEGILDGRVIDENELAAADAILAQMLREAPSPELDKIHTLVSERASVADVKLAAGVWFETHAIGVEPERPSEHPSIASGERLFARYCTSCHGAEADGAGTLAEHIEGAPPADFTDVEFMGGETQEEFFQAITLGVPGSAMPAWADILGERDRWDLVAYLWSLRGPTEISDDYAESLVVCATCHGNSGGAPNLTEPGALAGISDGELVARVMNSSRHGQQELVDASELVIASRFLAMVESRPGDGDRAVDPKHVSLALRLIAEEYVDAVRDGRVISDVEYGESRLFQARLAADIEKLTADGKLGKNLGAKAAVDALGEAILMREPAAVIETRTAAVADLVLPALGVEAANTATEAMAAVSRIVATARQTAATDPQRASDLLLDAYIEFEPVERRVGARDPGLVAEVERRFSSLRGELGAGRNDVAGFDALSSSLAQVSDAGSAPDSWYGVFIASLLIILREGLEVILVVSALAAYLSKGGHATALRWLYGGAWVGIVISILTAFLLDRMLDNVAVGQEVLEGVTMLIAAGVLFSVSYWLISKVEAKRWQDYIQRSLNHALGQSSNFAMAGVSFLAVYREGFETVLFYRALAVDVAAAPVISGFLAGSVLLAGLWVGITWFSLRIPLKPFFGLTGGLLYLLAFRFMGAGVGELQAAGVLPITPVGWWPNLPILAMSANMETGVVQLLLVVAAALAAAVLWSSRGQDAAAH
jgi:FTR1 family protein